MIDGRVKLLISQDVDADSVGGELLIGWLLADENSYLWLVFGSTKDMKSACDAARRVRNKSGKRPVFMSFEPLKRGEVMCGTLANLTTVYYREDII